jgi:hypothetical protein
MSIQLRGLGFRSETTAAILAALFFSLPCVSNARWTSQIEIALLSAKELRPIIADAPCLRKYQVVYGQAHLVAAILKEAYKKSPARISAAGENGILVWGSPSGQKEIAEQLLPYQIVGK